MCSVCECLLLPLLLVGYYVRCLNYAHSLLSTIYHLGTHVHGFPNMFTQQMGQNAVYAVNVPHNYVEQGKTVGAIIQHATATGSNRIELSKDEEDKWVDLILSAQPRRMMGECTPGYYNNEGKSVDQDISKYYQAYPKGSLAYFKYIQQWRSDGKFEGLTFRNVQ